MSSMGTLYVVATPIGNLKDITLRAIEILFTVDGIACEDTRKTGRLLHVIPNLFRNPNKILNQVQDDKKKPWLISYYEQNEVKRIPEIITALKNGLDIALVSDAGTPTISDPGFKLVRECITQRIRVESIPGPSSILAAFTSSGLPTDKFSFLGFLPHKKGKRIKLLERTLQSMEVVNATVICFEAPHRLTQALQEFQSVFGDIQIVIARELTKVYEEIRREKISASLAHFTKVEPKGEFVILFNTAEQERSPVTKSVRVE